MVRGRNLFAVACISLLLHVIGYSQYCIPTSAIGPREGHFIDGIKLENINNLNTGDSLNPTYNDYTNISTALFKNTNYTLEIISGYAFTDMHYVAWADFNNDGDFDNVNEKLGEVISTASYQTNSINFTVPTNAVNGTVRLRITGVYNVIGPDPCAPLTYGEIEDYSIILFKPTTFKDIGAPLRATSRGAVSWIDLNNDKNLEACVTGKYDSLPNLIADVYLNEGSDVFSYNQTFVPISNGDHAWFDYDHDGDVDYVYSGFNIYKSAGLYRFDGFDANDTSQFTFLYNNLFHFSLFSSVAWGDYDNDGDYDVLLSGIDTLNEVVLEMYTNIGGDFEYTPMELPAVFGGDVQFIDFDLDCDLDLFISGTDNNTNTLTRLMVNNEGVFSEFDYPFPNLEYGNIDWNDFNTDGYPDLIINGFDGNNPRLEVFLNDSGNTFYNGVEGLPEGNTGDVSFGDFNNDGLNDIIVTGPRTDSLDGYPIFLNSGNNSLVSLPFFMEQGSNSFVALGDYDNDQDLDFLVNGNLATSDQGKWKSQIFNNESSVTNNPPDVPTGLTVELYGTQVLLRWNHSTDDHTPKNLLTYNIYMGTSPQGIDVVTPNADVNSGNRFISIPGYIQDTCWIIRDLEIDTFYWSVQAIDNSLNASAFATEDTIIIQERISKNCELTLSETIINTVDYDKDGNMDLLTRIGDTLYIRKNEDGFNTFDWSNSVELDCELDPSDVQVSFVDFDNDGDMDFLPTQELDSMIYLYRRVAGNIKKVNYLSFYNTNGGYGLWCDFNNDGDKEYLTSGEAVKYNSVTNKPVTLMYEPGNSGSYTMIEHNIPAFTKCGATTGDFDNDLDMDLVIFGLDTLGQAQICLFRNDGNFKFKQFPIEHISLYRFNELNNIYAGDFNLDGLLDFYVNGRDDFQNKFAKVMINNGDGSFTDAELEIRSWEKTGNYWIDYDNDGDLDIISYSSLALGYNYVNIYLIQNGKIDEELKLDFVKNISGDKPLYFHNYDKLNSIDFVYTYKDVFNYICCNRDNWGEFSRKPRRIRKLISDQDGFDVILKWPRISGTEGFSFNLMVGSSSINADIVAPESGLNNGNRFVGKPGNASIDTAWKLSDLPTGNYFWKIQVIDNSYQGGSWSELSLFTVSSSAPDFTFNEACLGDTTYFTNLTVSSDTILEWKWWYKGSVVSNEENPKVVFKNAGTFDIRLEVITSSGTHVDKTHSVTVKRRPSAEYTLDPVCFGNASVLSPLIDTSEYVIDSWLWDLGNSETSAIQDTIINTYIANTPTKLTIIDTNGCGDSVSNVAVVTPMPDPEITFENGFVVSTCDNDSVILTTQYDSNFTYRWIASLVNATTGGQAVAGDSNVLAIINYTPDLYQLKVLVTNELGKCTITSDSIEIEVRKSPAKPLIEAQDVTSICELDSVPIEVISGEVDNYVWYLDESELNNPSPLLIAKENGEYRATVVDTNGCDSDKSDSVFVNVSPIPFIGDVFVDGPTEFCEGESVTLGFTEAEPGAKYQWKRNNVIIFATNRNTVDARHKGNYHMEATFDNFKCFRKSENVEVDVLVYPAKPLLDVDSSWINMCPEEKIALKPKIIQPYSYHWYRNGYLFDSIDSPVLDSVLPEGSYTVICFNFDCSSESDSVYINRKAEVLKPSIEPFGSKVWYLGCPNDSADGYRWYINDTLISDEKDHICMANQRLGVYKLAIKDGNGCWHFSDTVKIPTEEHTKKALSVNNQVSFEIFPNPNNGQFSLKLSSKLITDNTLRIYSRSGLLVKQIILKEQSHTEDSPINVTGLPTGVYHLELTSKQSRYIKKLIIE